MVAIHPQGQPGDSDWTRPVAPGECDMERDPASDLECPAPAIDSALDCIDWRQNFPHTVTLGPGWQALGYSTTTIDGASGQHAGQLLVIVEEASGLEKEMWDAIESLGYTKLVAIGNPLKAEGGFVDLCNQALSDQVRGVPTFEAACYKNLPSTASPHATWSKSPVGLADRTWLDACERKYGRDSLWFRCHVLAIRPSLVNEQLIPEADLDRCVTRETQELVTRLRQ